MKYIVLISSLLIITISFLLLKDINLRNEQIEEKKFVEGNVFIISSLTNDEIKKYEIDFIMGEGHIATTKNLEQINSPSNLVKNSKTYKNETLYLYHVF